MRLVGRKKLAIKRIINEFRNNGEGLKWEAEIISNLIKREKNYLLYMFKKLFSQ